MARLTLPVFALLFIFFVPIIVPIGLCLGFSRTRRLRAQAKASACIVCQAILGLEALRLADVEWKVYMADLRQRHPNAKIRVVRSLHAICPECGTHYRYRKSSDHFERILPRQSRTESPAADAGEMTRDSVSET